MSQLTIVMISLIIILHLSFLYLEMFAWTTPTGMKIFKHTQKDAEKSRVLAANQGLYNGFLALGLMWSLVESNNMFATKLAIFFLALIITAGVFGAITADRKILYIQALPAVVTLCTIIFYKW